MSDVEALKNWVSAQTDAPKLHINGNDHPTALVVVDFGQPLRGTQMTSERSAEISNLLKAAAKSLTRRRGQIRAQYDNHHGVYWASIS